MTTMTRTGMMTDWASRGNEHIPVPRLRELLKVQLATMEEDLDTEVQVEPLGVLKPGVDSTTKALIRTRSGRPVAVVVCSRPASPDLMARSVLFAEQFREAVGPDLGRVVIRSLNCGYVDGRSYVILPWHRSPAQRGIGRAWACRKLRRPVLDWLHRAVEAGASRDAAPTKDEESFARVLHSLSQQNFLSEDDRAAVERARARLASGEWPARYTVDHNDLWFGNVLLADREYCQPGPAHPFVLIDWAGANPTGYGVFDLVRIAKSMKVPHAMLGRELVRHASALQCELSDLEGHLLAGLGRLHRRIEYFPLENYIRMFRQCRETLKEAMRSLRSI